MKRALFLVMLMVAEPASADVDLSLLGGWGSAGPTAGLEAMISPWGFVALGAGVDRAGEHWGGSLKLRLGLDVLRTVPRLQLALGLAGSGAYFDADLGADRFLTRRLALRALAGWGSLSGWRARGGLAWFPFD